MCRGHGSQRAFTAVRGQLENTSSKKRDRRPEQHFIQLRVVQCRGPLRPAMYTVADLETVVPFQNVRHVCRPPSSPLPLLHISATSSEPLYSQPLSSCTRQIASLISPLPPTSHEGVAPHCTPRTPLLPPPTAYFSPHGAPRFCAIPPAAPRRSSPTRRRLGPRPPVRGPPTTCLRGRGIAREGGGANRSPQKGQTARVHVCPPQWQGRRRGDGFSLAGVGWLLSTG